MRYQAIFDISYLILRGNIESMISVVSVFNFIRRTVYPSGRLVQDDIDTVLSEIESVKQRGLKATYALKYDALMEEAYIEIIKNNTDKNDEIACWWEIDSTLAKKAGIKMAKEGSDVRGREESFESSIYQQETNIV